MTQNMWETPDEWNSANNRSASKGAQGTLRSEQSPSSSEWGHEIRKEQRLGSDSSLGNWDKGDVLPNWCSGKESACQSRRHKRCGFDPCVEKIPRRRKWQTTPVFMDRGACQATDCGVTKSQKWLSSWARTLRAKNPVGAQLGPQFLQREGRKWRCTGPPNICTKAPGEGLASPIPNPLPPSALQAKPL